MRMIMFEMSTEYKNFMVLNTAIFDTDILIDSFRGVSQATDLFQGIKNQGGALSISTVTLAEIEAGIRQKERDFMETFLKFFHKIPVTEDIARKAGNYKQSFGRSHSVGLSDAIIAATAFVHKIPLYTLNSKHYPMADITVHIPYKKS